MLSTLLAVDTQGSKNTIQGDVKVIQVDYSNDASIKHALTGVDVVISTVPATAFDVQWKIAAASKEVDVKLFVPSEFGGVSEGATEGFLVEKASVQTQLQALGLPYTAFYTGAFADQFWEPYVSCYTPFFSYSVLLTRGPKVHKPRSHERESVYWWRWQQALSVHLQNRYCPICFLCLDTSSIRTTEEPFLYHRCGQ
jgi:hypothetical protein